MTTYFIPLNSHFEQQRQHLMLECNDLILATADYLETFYRIFKRNPEVPSLTWKWLAHFIPRAHCHLIPLTVEAIIGAAYFTAYIRLRNRYAPRDMFYFPVVQNGVDVITIDMQNAQLE